MVTPSAQRPKRIVAMTGREIRRGVDCRMSKSRAYDMEKERVIGVQRIFSKTDINERRSDFAYWQSQSYQTRLATLEMIRREYHQWRHGGAEPGFQRVHSIVKR